MAAMAFDDALTLVVMLELDLWLVLNNHWTGLYRGRLIFLY